VYNVTERNTGGHLQNALAAIVNIHYDPNGVLYNWIAVPARPFMWVRILSAGGAGSGVWMYTGEQMVQSGTGWESPNSPRIITPIYNSIEDSTDPIIQGNSINPVGPPVGSYPPGFSMQPIRGKPIVACYPGEATTGIAQAWYCQYINADDGTCEL
jgi:hypothetical protein